MEAVLIKVQEEQHALIKHDKGVISILGKPHVILF